MSQTPVNKILLPHLIFIKCLFHSSTENVSNVWFNAKLKRKCILLIKEIPGDDTWSQIPIYYWNRQFKGGRKYVEEDNRQKSVGLDGVRFKGQLHKNGDNSWSTEWRISQPNTVQNHGKDAQNKPRGFLIKIFINYYHKFKYNELHELLLWRL